MRAAIERYLSLTCGNDDPGEGRLAALAGALDDLLVGLRDLEDGQPSDDDTEALRMDYRAVYAEIGRRFPELGLYPSVDPLDLSATEILVGDAVDDAADIAVDLAEALWLWDNVGAASAAWELRSASTPTGDRISSICGDTFTPWRADQPHFLDLTASFPHKRALPAPTSVSALYRHDPQALSGTRTARPPVHAIVHGGRLRLGHRSRTCSTR